MTWVLLGLLAAVLISAMLLLQEHLKVNGVALALWCKVACVIVTLPFVIYYGLPSDWRFYAWLLPQAMIFAFSDVITFRILPEIGAGVLSRVLPGTVVTSFFLWFAVNPGELKQYADNPAISAAIIAVVCGTGWFASRLTKCDVTMQAVRRLWFPIVGNTLSPVLAKITTHYADAYQGAFGFTFAQALMMIAMWLGWIQVAKPVPWKSIVAMDTVKKSMMIGVITAVMVVTIVASFYFVDNPAYSSALQLVYAAIIIGAHKIMRKEDGSDLVSGAGIVACAMVLIVLKAQLGQ
jgi:hypothetical protein